MASVNTVLGPVDTADLGFTLSHEHVCMGAPGIRLSYPGFGNLKGALDEGAADLKKAYDAGVRTIIDVTTIDLGRDVEALREASQRSGVHIIAATGNHINVPGVFASATPELVADLFVREIEEGIEGTDIKAGIIKVASDRGGITPGQEVVLRAAAQTCKRTGIRISTHTWSPDRVGDQQVRILEEEGVDLDQVYIGHSNDDTDLDYRLGLLQKGVWVGLDRHSGGRLGTPNWEQRTELTMQLIKAGYAGRIMLGHDDVPYANWLDPKVREERQQINPDTYSFISLKVLPRLKELGASDADIDQIMVQNPRRFFEGG